MADDLRPKERGVLLALLLASSEPLTSKDLGITVDKPTRETLDGRGLITLSKRGNSWAHALTPAGRSWCLDDLASGVSRSGDSALERAFYALLDRLREGVSLRAVVDRTAVERPAVAKPTATAAVENEVRAAYRKRRPKPGAWVSLADIRDELAGVPPTAIDDALKNLVGKPGVYLEPESNQASLTKRDRDAAVRVGGEFNHYLKIDRA